MTADGIVENAILLDSYTIPKENAKSPNSAMIHSMYALADMGNGIELLKLYVEELRDTNTDGTIKRSYQLNNITKAPVASARVQGNILSPVTSTTSAYGYSVADLLNIVKSDFSDVLSKAACVRVARIGLKNDGDNGTITDDGNDIKASAHRKQLWLPAKEYAMVSSAIMSKNAGADIKNLKAVDYVYALDGFYVYENKSIGEFII